MKKLSMFIFMCVLIASGYCGTGYVRIVYKGLDNTHIQVYYDSSSECTVKLVCNGEILFSRALQPNVSISEKIHHTGLSNDTYTYNLYEQYPGQQDILVSSAAVSIDGEVNGTLLFDETLDSPARIGNVIVPAGKTLNINADITYGEIDAYGNIILTSGITVNGTGINFYSQAVSITDIKGTGGFEFGAQASGSSVENCELSSIRVSPNTSITVKKSKVGWIYTSESSTLDVEDSEISSGIGVAENASVELNNCIITTVGLDNSQNFKANNTCFLYVWIRGGSPEFSRCEFLGEVRFSGRNTSRFEGCIFGNSVLFTDSETGNNSKWSDSSSEQPIFSNSSFVGRYGPYFEGTTPYAPIDLGINYYGDRAPDTDWFSIPIEHNELPYYPQGGKFLKRGVPVNKKHFKIEKWNESGSGLKCDKALPDIWINDYVVGQNTIPWPNYMNTSRQSILLKGRQTLLSLDIATNHDNVSGVTFKVLFDGQEISPINSIVLSRGIPDNKNKIFYGETTLNFILPPTDKDVVLFEVRMDTTNIVGFDDVEGKGESYLYSRALEFSPSYARQLNILVQPVQLFITGYTPRVPNASSVANALKNLIPAMLPIDKKDLHIWTAPTTTFYGGVLSMFSTTALLNRIANSLALTQGFVNTTAAVGDWLTGKGTAKIDFIVAVMPKGSMGEDVTGVNLPLRRGIIFVDESAPDAALHEMGHAIGLYTSKEQYDQFPPAGLPVEGLTAFVNDASSSITGFRGRVLHFPRETDTWYEEKYWYDIMGSSTTSIWPIWGTLGAFGYSFRQILGDENKSAKSLVKGVPSGYKRIFVSAETIRYATIYYMKEGSINAFEITDLATGKVDVPLQWSGNGRNDYTIKCFDKDGNEILSQDFTIVSPYPNYLGYGSWPEESTWCGTFDIPENTSSIRIYPRPGWWNNFQSTPIFEVNAFDYEPIKITGLLPGQQLGESVEIKWTQDNTKQFSNLQYLVMYSVDGGSSWLPVGLPVEGNKISLPTDFLTPSDDIVFKVIGSNGLGKVEAEVGGLKIENRPPKAIIITPKDGWVGEIGTKWILDGYGEDIEDGIITEGIWEIDGDRVDTKEVILSQGIHTITFKVVDSAGLEGSESINVEVKEMENIDIGLNEDSLQLFIEGKDPLNTSPIVYLKENGVHRAMLTIQNPGIDTIFTAALYLKKPGEQEQLLTEKTFTPGPFEEVVISETFIVTEPGQYQIRGEIKDIVPQDTNAENNESIWIYSTKPNTPVIGVSPDTLDYGSTRGRKEGFILVKNYGNADLTVSSITITGTDAVDFKVEAESPIILPADNLTLIPVYFVPKTKGIKESVLKVVSNDSENPEVEIILKGECTWIAGDIQGDNVIDISDIILCLRQAILIDEQDIEAADMNDDGLIDISDVILILRKAIGLE
ncbi:MAG TPA: hypothetical protein PK303_06640 [bacterium]|nr:hypothetical protein [bacterium]HPP08778.1 hypothetical protein [bacterium]